MASLRCGATLHVSGANYLSTIVWSDGRSAEDGSTSDMPCHVEEEGTGWPCLPDFGWCGELVDGRVVTFSGTTLSCVSETRIRGIRYSVQL